MSRPFAIAAALAGLYEVEGVSESCRRPAQPEQEPPAPDDALVLAVEGPGQPDAEFLDLGDPLDQLICQRRGFRGWLKQALRRWLRKIAAPEALQR